MIRVTVEQGEQRVADGLGRALAHGREADGDGGDAVTESVETF
jgi:hypothetical protein